MKKQLLRNAFLLATKKHQHQKYGDSPYTVHLHDVENVLREFGHDDEKYLAAAWLHDVIEDTPTHYSEVEQATSKDVAEIVFALTDEIGRNRKERQKKTKPKVHACPDALVVKLADIISNYRDARRGNPGFIQMYKKGHPEFETEFRGEGSPLEPMWEEAHKLLYG